jgi:hypothetical protein
MKVYLLHITLLVCLVGISALLAAPVIPANKTTTIQHYVYTDPFICSDQCHSAQTVHIEDLQVCSDECHWSQVQCHSPQGSINSWPVVTPCPFWQVGVGKWAVGPLKICTNFFDFCKRLCSDYVGVNDIRILRGYGGRLTHCSFHEQEWVFPLLYIYGYGKNIFKRL